MEKREKNLAYGGQALIEGVLMRGGERYAFTVRTPEGRLHKEKSEYRALGQRFKVLGLPFVRGIVGFIENMFIGMRILNRSAEIAFPEEKQEESSNLSIFIMLATAILISLSVFVALPYFLTHFTGVSEAKSPVLYNLVAGLIRMAFFFVYLLSISLMRDTKRLFGYHGAEHKTIHAYEARDELNCENVKRASRLHPRCGTSFIFIVFLITLIIFPFFSLYFNSQLWYTELLKMGWVGTVLQKLIVITSHIVLGMPLVASISYELLKLSAKFQNSLPVKILVAPGLFFQLFTTREPDEGMIEAAISSLKLVLGLESSGDDNRESDRTASTDALKSGGAALLLLPLYLFGLL